jgi:hypothetical protein
VLPPSIAELRRGLESELQQLATTSMEFGSLLRLLVPEFQIFLVRLCDGGHLLPRARVKIHLAGSIRDAPSVPGLLEMLSHESVVDLFVPPQRAQIRETAVGLAAPGVTQKQIAERIPGCPTATAVGDAIALQRKMDLLGLTSPYVLVEEPPSDYPKLRRHRNPKYKFAAINGYERRFL